MTAKVLVLNATQQRLLWLLIEAERDYLRNNLPEDKRYVEVGTYNPLGLDGRTATALCERGLAVGRPKGKHGWEIRLADFPGKVSN